MPKPTQLIVDVIINGEESRGFMELGVTGDAVSGMPDMAVIQIDKEGGEKIEIRAAYPQFQLGTNTLQAEVQHSLRERQKAIQEKAAIQRIQEQNS